MLGGLNEEEIILELNSISDSDEGGDSDAEDFHPNNVKLTLTTLKPVDTPSFFRVPAHDIASTSKGWYICFVFYNFLINRF